MRAPELALSKHVRESVANAGPSGDPPLSVASRGLVVLFAVGLSVGFCIGFLLLKDPLDPYVTNNDMRPAIRRFVFGVAFGIGALAVLGGMIAAFRLRKVSPPADLLRRIAYRAAPLGVMGFLPLLFHWQAWRGRDMEFLTLVALSALTLEAGARARFAVEPTGPEVFVGAKLRRIGSDLASRFPLVAARWPLVVVSVGTAAYVAYFSYATIAWHHAVRSGTDMAVENNLLWNIVHGGPFFKSSPLGGAGTSRFGDGATWLAYLIAPIYALHQAPETLYIVQATLIGAAAIPLFLYARLYLGGPASCLLALAYLSFPAVHGSNLFDFHYLPLSAFFVWLALYALESRRHVLAAVAVVLALSTTEDVALALVALGIYLLVTARQPRAGLVLACLSAFYFATMKLWVLPRFHPAAMASAYQRVLPTGDDGFTALIKTVIANPWYTVGTVLDDDKATFALQMLVPLALLPLRRPVTLLLALPALLFTTLSSSPSLSSIHYQFSTHWTTFLFISTVLVLARHAHSSRRACLWALALATLACSYQYGAVLQRNTAASGVIPFKFGLDREGRARRRALSVVLRDLPPRAKVSSASFITSQVSSRPDAYVLANGVQDAEYVLFGTLRSDFLGNEFATAEELLQSNTFGVIDMELPFALAKKGEKNTARNAEALAIMR
jgi:uncharacterized membrane protein